MLIHAENFNLLKQAGYNKTGKEKRGFSRLDDHIEITRCLFHCSRMMIVLYTIWP